MNKLRICVISDTHNQHREIDLLIRANNIDLLIHAGDGSVSKNPVLNNNELRDCLDWMQSFEDIPYKIYVPGNHDTSMETGFIKQTEYPNIDILIDSSINIMIADSTVNPSHVKDQERIIKIYGSPITPTFGKGWAYNCERYNIHQFWDQIPEDVNILVTHGPPKGILDIGTNLQSEGCKTLLNKVMEIQPQYHVFGHFHDSNYALNHGSRTLGNKSKTVFINASIVNGNHDVVNKPIIFEI